MNQHHRENKTGRKWLEWIDSDHSLAALLFFLVVYGFVVYPLVGEEAHCSVEGALSFTAVLLLGVMATTKRHSTRFFMTVLAALTFASHWLHFILQLHAVHLISASASALFFGVLSCLITARVFRGGNINIFRIYGAIAVYLLLGIMWGELYIIIYLLEPNAFYFLPATQYGEPPISELIYFSFVSLTTMGYGDIVPIHPMARSLATLEGLVGQLYPAVLLARLVTLYQK